MFTKVHMSQWRFLRLNPFVGQWTLVFSYVYVYIMESWPCRTWPSHGQTLNSCAWTCINSWLCVYLQQKEPNAFRLKYITAEVQIVISHFFFKNIFFHTFHFILCKSLKIQLCRKYKVVSCFTSLDLADIFWWDG